MRQQDARFVEAVARLVAALRTAESLATAAAAAATEMVSICAADIAAVVLDGRVLASAGPRRAAIGSAEILAATTAGPAADITGLGRCDVALGTVEEAPDLRLVVLQAQGSISGSDRDYLTLAAGIFAMTVDRMTALDTARELQAQTAREAEEHNRLVGSLVKRQQLLDNLGRIERSISRRIPLGEVLGTITDAVHQLLGDDLVALRLIDPDDPEYLILVSDSGVSPDAFNAVRRTPVGLGAGGRAVLENKLILIPDYAQEPGMLEIFSRSGVRAALAAPVHEGGTVVGSLTVATYDAQRRYGAVEQETLLAFAEHVSLALTDARSVAAMHAAEQVKDNLLAMVSHELKTPLTVMLGVVQTIQRHATRLPDEVRDEMLTSAQARGYELGQLIDRLLEGAQQTSTEGMREASLPAVITAATAAFAATGRQLLIAPVPPQPLRVDVGKLHAVLTGLIDTALSHSPEHTPLVLESEVTAGIVSVIVTARGELPDAADVDALLERSPHPATSGLGFGLYFAGQLAAALGGTLSLSSANGMMSFTLRFAAGAQAATATPNPSQTTR